MLRPKRVPFNGSPNVAEQARQAAAGAAANATASPPAASASSDGAPHLAPKVIRSVYAQRPTAVGPGGDLCRANITRCGEVKTVAGQLMKAVPMVAAALGTAANDLIALNRQQLIVMAEFQSQVPVIEQQNRRLAMAAATELVKQNQIQPGNRTAEIEKRADAMVGAEQDRVLQSIVEVHASDAVTAVNESRDSLLDSQNEIERATFKDLLGTTLAADADFQRGSSAMATMVQSQPFFDQGTFALNTTSSAIRLGELQTARQIKFGVLPYAIQQVAEGVAARRTAVARAAGREGAATRDIQAWTKFIAVCSTIDSPARDVLAIAREAQKMLAEIFMRSGGRDLSDPASTSNAEFRNFMHNQKPMSLDVPHPIDAGDDGLRWLTRPLRVKSFRPLSPWSENVALKPTAGKAVSK